MGIVHNPDSDYARELEKWNQPTTNGGFSAARFEEYPLMVYKAFQRENGKVMCGDPRASVGDEGQGIHVEKRRIGNSAVMDAASDVAVTSPMPDNSPAFLHDADDLDTIFHRQVDCLDRLAIEEQGHPINSHEQ